MFDRAITILQLSLENKMIDAEEARSAINILKVRPASRLNTIARHLSLAKDTYHKFWAADEGLRYMTRLLEEELEILRSLTSYKGGENEELEVEVPEED